MVAIAPARREKAEKAHLVNLVQHTPRERVSKPSKQQEKARTSKDRNNRFLNNDQCEERKR